MAAMEGVDISEGDENHVDELSLDADLDELDDKEFDLPPVENPPTLESILNAPDEDGSLQESSIIIQVHSSRLQVSWKRHCRQAVRQVGLFELRFEDLK